MMILIRPALFAVGVIAVLCLSQASCATFKRADPAIVPVNCIVQSEAAVLYEIHLDGKLVSSGKTLPPGKGAQLIGMTATPGDHVLMVTAPGYETWQRTVTIMSGTKLGSSFRVDLKKSEK